MTVLQRAPHARVLQRLRRREERGSATVFVLGMAITLLVCAGLVLDGGQAMNARTRMADNVEQAARAGAQQIDVPHLRATGEVRLDGAAAEARAQDFISSFNYPNVAVTVTGNQIRVEAKDVVDAQMLSLIGVDTFDVGASATSQAVTR
ncbi:pilus assembly protein TadG-related protein [Nocardioides daphniae]|uniref:Putative Flp pilus-assembly TadG-like N-terminal domain-containing protein n=1 Tax=Nocardioides daphniae TaxID=402297 RepID=A0A4P7UDI8_9ACTN|nr:pilus assembly protein TadG-related protein [Nocardioides daphniae]QCC77914.1 hypothetical protein E2C04_13300 [Nocardioides daphniae]GGD24079.1 hypothetical protein GCM10007231_24010 [Nocardioides daphniae]